MKMSQIREKAKYAIWFCLIAFISLIVFGGGMSGSSVTGVFQKWFNPDYVDTTINVAKIDGEDINKSFFMRQVTGNPQSATLDNILPNEQQEKVESALNAFANSTIILDEIEDVNLTTSNKELDYYLKEYPPLQYQILMMINGYFRTKTGDYSSKLAYINCNVDESDEKIKGTICEEDETWSPEMGNNKKDEGEEFFDLNKWKTSYGTDWNSNESLYNQMTQFEAQYRTIDLPNAKLNYLYSQIGYVSENKVKQQAPFENDKYTLNQLIANYDQINTAEVSITEAEIQKYYDENKENEFSKTASISIEYALFKNLSTNLDKTTTEKTNSISNSKQRTQANKFSQTARTKGFEIAKSDVPMIDIEEEDGLKDLTAETSPYSGKGFKDDANILFTDEQGIKEYLVKRPALFGKIDLHEEFDREKSGFKNYEYNYTRSMVRYAFDNVENEDGSISPSFSTNAGHFVFQITGINESGYADLNDVKEQIKVQLILEKKKELAKNKIQESIDKKKSFIQIAENLEYVELILSDYTIAENEIAGFVNKSIFISNFIFKDGGLVPGGPAKATIANMESAQAEIAGCLSVMNKGEFSYIIESETENKLFVVELIDKVVSTDDTKLAEKRTSLYETVASNFYNSWLEYTRDSKKIINKVHKVY